MHMTLDNLRDLQGATVDVRLDRRHVEHRDGDLRIRGLRTELVVGIAEGLADRVHADEGARRKEVLALEGARAHRVLLRPDAIRVLREQLRRCQLVTRVAARRGLGTTEVSRTR